MDFSHFSYYTAFITLCVLIATAWLYRRFKRQHADGSSRFCREQIKHFTDMGFVREDFGAKFSDSLQKHGDGLRYMKTFFADHPRARGKVCPYAGQPTVLFCEAPAARQFLQSAQYYTKEKGQAAHLTLLGKGLMFSEGAEWHAKRVLYGQYLTRDRVTKDLAPKIDEYCENYVLRARSDNAEFALHNAPLADVLPRLEKAAEGIIFFMFLGDTHESVRLFGEGQSGMTLGEAIKHVVAEIVREAQESEEQDASRGKE